MVGIKFDISYGTCDSGTTLSALCHIYKRTKGAGGGSVLGTSASLRSYGHAGGVLFEKTLFCADALWIAGTYFGGVSGSVTCVEAQYFAQYRWRYRVLYAIGAIGVLDGIS